ncbi:hypothetical protein RJ641_004915 [Dillenia turbinata]|uniref:Uncharacterized protein n=1 Tax=Dillenia turbinata TaxID=194707 RepID=A0AAN8ZAZ1_9MAGN
MEPVKIDWENIDSKFVEDDLYEHINAPKWVDFSAPDIPDNDEAWFCRSDCNHPKTVEDFLKSKTPTKKILGIADSSEAKRDLNLKRRALKSEKSQTNPSLKFKEDGENQNPNFSTPLSSLSKSKKAEFKSSDEKKKQVQNLTKTEPMPQLKSTRSARNLFSGRDIIGHVSEFVTELKKLAMKAREGEEKREKGEEKCGEVVDDVRENVEKRPLLEAMHKEKVEAAEKSNNAKEKLKRK